MTKTPIEYGIQEMMGSTWAAPACWDTLVGTQRRLEAMKARNPGRGFRIVALSIVEA